VCSSVPVPAWSGIVIPLRDTPPIHGSGRSSLSKICEYVGTCHTIHPLIHSQRPSIPCGCCTCLEFFVTQCSVCVVTGFLLSASKDSLIHCIISSLMLTAILELSFCTVSLQQFSVTALLKSHSFIHWTGRKLSGLSTNLTTWSASTIATVTQNWSSCCNVICVCWRRRSVQKPRPTCWNHDRLAVTFISRRSKRPTQSWLCIGLMTVRAGTTKRILMWIPIYA